MKYSLVEKKITPTDVQMEAVSYIRNNPAIAL